MASSLLCIAIDQAEKYHNIKGVLKNFGDQLAVKLDLIALVDDMKDVWPQNLVEPNYGIDIIPDCHQYRRCKHVANGTQTDGRGILELWKKSLKPEPLGPYPSSTVARRNSAIAAQNLDLEKVQAIGDLKIAKEEELWILGALDSYLGYVGKMITMLPIQVCTSVVDVYFNGYEDGMGGVLRWGGTIERKIKVIKIKGEVKWLFGIKVERDGMAGAI
ncbi:hypothetical protein BU17DRAFT_60936 [Hysterangium stoloniferum]|nr:hypothetical protein BU17DRAFT_60936 [Hysterangium stoloniferum]